MPTMGYRGAYWVLVRQWAGLELTEPNELDRSVEKWAVFKPSGGESQGTKLEQDSSKPTTSFHITPLLMMTNGTVGFPPF
jgi:hypothetical protein